MSAADTLLEIIKIADEAFDAVAPVLGLAEATPIADALAALAEKAVGVVNKTTPVLDAEVAAAQAAAKAAALAAGLK